MTEKKLNLKEIIEIAIQIETSGAAFYKRLGSLAESEEAKELFEELEEAEYEHISDFETVLKGAVARHGQHEYATTETDLLYLRAFATRRIFTSPENAIRIAENFDNVIEAIDMALDFELRAADFYREMAQMIEDPDDRASVAELEKQEKEHAAYLYRVRKRLTDGEGGPGTASHEPGK